MTLKQLYGALNLLLTLCSGCLGLRNVRLWAPVAVRGGSGLALVCSYELDTSPLYSIKFYLQEQEFYRYVPKESPPTRVFHLPHVHVDLYRSNASVVYLERVQKELSGQYKCEVTADAPYFETAIKRIQVYVTEEPLSNPELYVDKSKYTLGEKVRANCTSRFGFPAANLTFFVNNLQVRNTYETRLWSGVEVERGGLESSVLEMEATATARMFRDSSKAKISCLASQFNLYSRTVSTFIFEDTPQLAHVLGPSSPKGVNNNNGCVSPSISFLLLALVGCITFLRHIS